MDFNFNKLGSLEYFMTLVVKINYCQGQESGETNSNHILLFKMTKTKDLECTYSYQAVKYP